MLPVMHDQRPPAEPLAEPPAGHVSMLTSMAPWHHYLAGHKLYVVRVPGGLGCV
jgi:hypothetical protein